MHLVVDGMNVIGARAAGWWRDRDGAVRRLVHDLQRLVEAHDDDVTVVLDGRPLEDLPEGEHLGVQVLYARRRGRDAADDRIVQFVSAHPDASTVRVVTSDRALGVRAHDLGADVVGASQLLGRIDRLDDT
jgi:predicted RNA-binding protein with PIN domain